MMTAEQQTARFGGNNSIDYILMIFMDSNPACTCSMTAGQQFHQMGTNHVHNDQGKRGDGNNHVICYTTREKSFACPT